ncbi:GntR family transcriptional regulator [Virgibacillus pantothenticus]|uniref:GntR family transcriptional regulator n=1 Tax=Virgibacillus pantothenticus TaxID=1473 RepID=UPI0009865854|nr:GntR family transcriptional regulator [Virgibacillus pantothenticus]
MRIIKPESLHLQAYAILKGEILEGEYRPGERIVEAKIANKLGISRGPVREAIRMLIQDGLLMYNDGYVRVYQPTLEDVVDIFQCRESLEALAVSLAIEQITDNEKKQLANNLELTYHAYQQKKSIELSKLDQEFHDIIIQASRNKQLIELLDVIRTKIHYMRITMVQGEFYPSFVSEHEKLIRFLVDGKETKATTLMKTHIQKGLEGVLMHIGNVQSR